jgi:hypothetical protein
VSSGSIYRRGSHRVFEIPFLEREQLERVADLLLSPTMAVIAKSYWREPLPLGHRLRLQVTVEPFWPLTEDELAAIEADYRRDANDP